jgi:beta-galactosidase
VRDDETGLLIRGSSLFEFTASHYSASDLYGAAHTHELTRRDETIVHLDVHQRGLGGASCGPDTLQSYRIGSGRHRLDFSLQLFDPASGGLPTWRDFDRSGMVGPGHPSRSC